VEKGTCTGKVRPPWAEGFLLGSTYLVNSSNRHIKPTSGHPNNCSLFCCVLLLWGSSRTVFGMHMKVRPRL